MSVELQGDALDLFIPSPNKRSDLGDTREKFVVNPLATSHRHLRFFRTLGVVIGVCIRTGGAFDLRLPSLFWKFFVGEELTLGDLEAFDLLAARFIRTNLTSPELFEAISDGLTFTTTLSDGQKVELKPGGSQEAVTIENRLEYAHLVLEARLHESTKQMEAIREGMAEIIPVETLRYLTWQEMEALVVGRVDFDVEWLKKRTRYYGSFNATHPTVQMLWEVLSEAGPEVRSKFLRFVYGQSHVAPVMRNNLEFIVETIDRDSVSPDLLLPEAMTCSFKLKLPIYSSKAILQNKLMYAIQNTTEIDSDFVPATQWNAIGDAEETSDSESDEDS